MPEPDHAAARIHRRNAERHWAAAERLRKNGLPTSAAAAEQAARDEDHVAEIYETGHERKRVAR